VQCKNIKIIYFCAQFFTHFRVPKIHKKNAKKLCHIEGGA
jgi:hypothetical protein